jgi:hypothetical protein
MTNKAGVNMSYVYICSATWMRKNFRGLMAGSKHIYLFNVGVSRLLMLLPTE